MDRPSVINIDVPKQPRPIINIDVPRQMPPLVNVNVPAQSPPIMPEHKCPKQWVFDVQRDKQGRINTVIATPKY